MKSKLSKSNIEDFWIRVYLGNTGDLINLSIDRAYRDFNRTMHGLQKLQSKTKYSELKSVFLTIIEEVTSKKFGSQLEFDKWHLTNCRNIKSKFKSIYNYDISFGQSQKWLNMTLKYLFALGEIRIKGISKNYKFFHIPIDNIVLKELNKLGIKRFKIAWSRLDDYAIYLNYQKKVREYIGVQIPMDFEFIIYNK
jgi:hypothetical protein